LTSRNSLIGQPGGPTVEMCRQRRAVGRPEQGKNNLSFHRLFPTLTTDPPDPPSCNGIRLPLLGTVLRGGPMRLSSSRRWRGATPMTLRLLAAGLVLTAILTATGCGNRCCRPSCLPATACSAPPCGQPAPCGDPCAPAPAVQSFSGAPPY